MLNYRLLLSALALAGVLTTPHGPDAWADSEDDLDCNQCVEKEDIAKNAIVRNRIRNNAVTGKKIKDGSVELEDLSPALQEAMANLQLLAELAAFITVDEVETDLNGDGVIDPVTERLPRILIEGANVQIVNGDASQATDSLNGLGNLIVGYNEPRDIGGGGEVCSIGEFDDQVNCETNGHVWAENHKSGSHNLVVGPRNAYSQAGGVVFGADNAVNSLGATVTGGLENNASGEFSSVSGGDLNVASGEVSSVSGGGGNLASGVNSSVSGGVFDRAVGDFSSVSGGEFNTASANSSSVSGGNGVTISGDCNWGGEDMGATVFEFGDGTC